MSRAATAFRGLAVLGVALVAAGAEVRAQGLNETVLRGDIDPRDGPAAIAPAGDIGLRPSLPGSAMDFDAGRGVADVEVLPGVEQPLDRLPIAAGSLGLTTPAPRRRTIAEADPFAPVGVRVGAFVATPFAELRGGYDSNALRVPDGAGSLFTQASGGFAARSDWSRHALDVELRGGYTAYENVTGNNRPDAAATLRGRIDVSSLVRIDAVLRGVLTTNAPGSVDSVANAKQPPLIFETGLDLGITRRFNRLELGVAGIIERQDHRPAELTDGTTESQADQNVTGYGVRLRGAYEVSPSFKPFVQMVADTRVYDIVPDSEGLDRDSNGLTVSTGAELALSGLVTGSASIGYTWRRYSDPLLEDISGLVADAALRWAASGLTTVTLTARSGVEETTFENASGDFVHQMQLEVEHAFRRWLIGSASVAYRIDDYEGTDLTEETLTLAAGLRYRIGRTAEVMAELSHLRLNSSVPGDDYTANVVQIGLRLQR
ncbi:MAG TPA: outer membrane beta-barrel protein [Xanthobacteraceae bacterium]|nr:outer membrane beta-barrel protein [Xanthobacteraceae bacterium]